MFKIQRNPTFKTRVGISVPGESRPSEIGFEFKFLKKSEAKDYFEGLSGKTDAQALAEIIVGWEGTDQAYSEEALEALLDNYPAAAANIFDKFRAELLEAKRKN